MASVDSSRIKKKYVVAALRNFTPSSPNDSSGHKYGITYDGFWVSGQSDTFSDPAYAPFDDDAFDL
jgi:hypothetical protein